MEKDYEDESVYDEACFKTVSCSSLSNFVQGGIGFLYLSVETWSEVCASPVGVER